MKLLLRKYLWPILMVLTLIGYVMFFRTAEVSGTSMVPTYATGDLLLVRRTKSANPGDIVVIYSDSLNELLCKRVSGVAGDHVVITDAGLSVNDELISEDYVSVPEWYLNSAKVDVIVPDEELFVMGDNRIVSNDSRALGCLPTSKLTGVVVWNLTQSIGVRRETLIRFSALIIVVSIVLEIIRKMHGNGNKTTESNE